jgi:hypothetical protein
LELGSCPEIELEKHNSPLNLTGFCVQGIFSPSKDIETENQLKTGFLDQNGEKQNLWFF